MQLFSKGAVQQMLEFWTCHVGCPTMSSGPGAYSTASFGPLQKKSSLPMVMYLAGELSWRDFLS